MDKIIKTIESVLNEDLLTNFNQKLKESYINQDNVEEKKLARLEIRDTNGNMIYQVKNQNIELSFQDDGQTLKITIHENFTNN